MCGGGSDPNGETRTVCGVRSRIAFTQVQEGLVTIPFIPAGYTQSFAELSAEEKPHQSPPGLWQRLPELFPDGLEAYKEACSENCVIGDTTAVSPV